ncbi:uncharacterized protein LOC124451811 [Xenia sp. Carnegie-2017]|uniref:uncharacterized protein LOC124451811 n=1 Tax=Xenia sp. Carnegie-2017 TaxID=2897299 RepID=UPI001F043C2E|nr:uncharacterized protein LOC124451811 [Xenia sp. Carnegie-2017]
MASRQNSAKNRRGGQYCVAGWPNGKSCTNSQHTEGVSVHRFPMNDKERLSKWTKFVRRHRPKFVPQQYSVLCSMHFADSAFTVNATVAKSLNMRRQLRSDAVPTIDSVKGISIQDDKSNRDRRVVSTKLYKLNYTSLYAQPGNACKCVLLSSKMTHFSWLGTYCRHVLAVLHFNENLHRQPKKNKKWNTILFCDIPKI